MLGLTFSPPDKLIAVSGSAEVKPHSAAQLEFTLRPLLLLLSFSPFTRLILTTLESIGGVTGVRGCFASTFGGKTSGLHLLPNRYETFQGLITGRLVPCGADTQRERETWRETDRYAVVCTFERISDKTEWYRWTDRIFSSLQGCRLFLVCVSAGDVKTLIASAATLSLGKTLWRCRALNWTGTEKRQDLLEGVKSSLTSLSSEDFLRLR